MAVYKAVLSAADEPSARQRTALRQMLNLSQWRGLSHTIAGSRGQTPRAAELFLFFALEWQGGRYGFTRPSWQPGTRRDKGMEA